MPGCLHYSKMKEATVKKKKKKRRNLRKPYGQKNKYGKEERQKIKQEQKKYKEGHNMH